ncbi:reverse transcriptase [Trichonephila clavipes]|nr:reverse transcriptase [Trichonephila clavipes]
MGNPGHCGSYPEATGESRDCCRFRLTTGHDFLGVYLHWLGLAVDETYPLYGHARMDGDHLLQCAGLDKYPTDDVVSRNCGAQRQMVREAK